MPNSAPKAAARLVALHVLSRIVRDGAFADRALDSALSKSTLERRDRGLATELVYGVLRRSQELDFYIGQLAKKPLSSLPLDVLLALRLGAYQLLHLRIPAHSAVNESVNLLPRKRAHLRGVVNGILRSLARQIDAKALPDAKVLIADPIERLAVTHSHPAWLIDKLLAQWPQDDVEAFCAANNQTPPLSVRVNTAKISTETLCEQWRAAGIEVQPLSPELQVALPNTLLLHGAGNVSELPGYAEGFFAVQDPAAQLTGEMLDIGNQGWYLDACAAPGGKTAHLAARLHAQSPSSQVLAMDVHDGKLRLVHDTVKRLSLDNVHTACVDVTHGEALQACLQIHGIEHVAGAIVDAPCSGLGTLRRAPERCMQPAPDLSALTQLQDRLLQQVAQTIAPGGCLVYAVCTVLQAEGAERVQAFLNRHREFALEKPANPLLEPFLAALGTETEPMVLSTSPHRHGMDGFFAALLRKKS